MGWTRRAATRRTWMDSNATSASSSSDSVMTSDFSKSALSTSDGATDLCTQQGKPARVAQRRLVAVAHLLFNPTIGQIVLGLAKPGGPKVLIDYFPKLIDVDLCDTQQVSTHSTVARAHHPLTPSACRTSSWTMPSQSCTVSTWASGSWRICNKGSSSSKQSGRRGQSQLRWLWAALSAKGGAGTSTPDAVSCASAGDPWSELGHLHRATACQVHRVVPENNEGKERQGREGAAGGTNLTVVDILFSLL